MSNQKLLKHALVQSNMFNMFEQLLQLQTIIQKICYMCNQLSKLLDTLFKKLSTVQYQPCPLCNILLNNLPKNVVQAMSTVQNTFRQPTKKCCPSHVHCNILLDKLPKYVVQAMSTVQYILRQPAKKCCPSHVHCAIYSQTTCQKMLSKPCQIGRAHV